MRARLGKSVVAAQPIVAGSIVTAEMLTVKSPGDGIPANQLEQLIGRVAAVDVAADVVLPREALDWQLRPASVAAGIGSEPA